MTSLIDKVDAAAPGIRLYGLAPPKSSTPTQQVAEIAEQQAHRLSGLGIDGLIVYDIQDEAGRVAEPRPFPFLPTVDPQLYASRYLAALGCPKVVYRCVNRDTVETFRSWLLDPQTRPELSVLVGAPSRDAVGALTLREAYALTSQLAPSLPIGGVAIAERHARSGDEHLRILNKVSSGCRFFVTQAVYDVTSTLSLLSDYAIATQEAERRPVPIILTFSPCGSDRTLTFMKWLGIAFPRWLENELRLAKDPLETSMRVCERIFAEVWDYARGKGIPLGVNVESISIRRVEVEASIELLRTLSQICRSAVT